MKNLYLIDDGEQWWIVATSREEARQFAVESYCLEADCIESVDEVPRDHLFT